MTNGFISCFRFGKQTVSKSSQKWIQGNQKLFGRQSAPFRMPHGLMPASTAASNDFIRRSNARQQSRQPFAMFYNRISRFLNSLIFTQDMQSFRPIPFGRINTSFVGRKVNLPLLAEFIDFSGFLYSRMIFPQNEHRVGILGKFRQQRKRCSVLVGKYRRRTSRIKSHTHYFLGSSLRTSSQGFSNGSFQYIYIILRMLAVLINGRITIFTFAPTWIIFDCGSYGFPGLRLNNNGTGRICSIVQTYYILLIHNSVKL